MRNKTKLAGAIAVLLSLHLAVFLAQFLAPCDPAEQNRDSPFAPPSRLHLVDVRGRFHLRPFVYRWVESPGDFHQYDEVRDREYPLRFLVRGPQYRFAGMIRSDLHLFGVDAPAQIFLAGADGYGRDQFSRILYGGQLSLAAGLLAAAASLFLGLLVGCISGFYGGWIDESAMRLVELFLVLPWLYLLLAVRSFLPLRLSAAQTFLLLVTVIGTIGWARPARLIRGVVLSDYYILRRHVLPETLAVLLTQAALLIPQYVVAEVTLSFLGLGLSEPAPSWGGLLANLQQYNVLVSYWWMFAPALALVILSLGYLKVANVVHECLQSGSV